MRPELDRSTYDLVRKLVDAAVRAKVAAENAHIGTCVGCGMPYADWTPGCNSCWERHRNYRTGRTRGETSETLRRLVLAKQEHLTLQRILAQNQSEEAREARREFMVQMHRDGRIGSWSTHREANAA